MALYGTDKLIAAKQHDLQTQLLGTMNEERIQLREEVQEQIRGLKELTVRLRGRGGGPLVLALVYRWVVGGRSKGVGGALLTVGVRVSDGRGGD